MLATQKVNGSQRQAPDADSQMALSLLDDMPAGVALLSAEGRVVYLNPVAQLRLDRPRSDILGQDFFREVLPQLEQEGVGERYRAGMAQGRVSIAVDAEHRSEGRAQRLHIGIRSCSSVRQRLGVLVLEDRSSLAYEEERRERAERLSAIGELARGVAHEVNNPLASIKSFAQLLLQDVQSSSHLQALEIISHECGRIAKIIDNLLDFAHSQDLEDQERINLSSLVEGVVQLKRYALETAGIEIQLDLDPAVSCVRGEVGALQRAILHLVLTSESSLNARRGHRMLVVQSRESTDGIIVSVADNGHGIPRDELPHLLDPTRSNQEPAHRIGLGITASVIRKHGGQFWVESVEGRGTAYFLRIPRAEGAPDELVVETTPQVVRNDGHRPLKVLIADDESSLRLALELFLGRQGHQVIHAGNAQDALRIAQEMHLDAALVDARMPGDGVALVDQLEEIPTLRGRVALMSGDVGYIRSRQQDNPDRLYLAKPFEMTEVVTLIEQLGQ